MRRAAEAVPRPERRSAARRPTRRVAVVAPLDPGRLLHRGVAADISLGGLCVHTRCPEPPGTPVEVEMPPGEDGGGPILVRGRVVRAMALGGGLHAMGIHLAVHASPVPPVDVVSAGARAEVRRLVSRVADQMRGLTPDSPSPLAVLEGLRPRTAVHPPLEARRRRRALAALVLLLLLLGWLVSRVLHDPGDALAGMHGRPGGAWLETVPPETAEDGAARAVAVAGFRSSAPALLPPRWTGPDFDALPPPGIAPDGFLPPMGDSIHGTPVSNRATPGTEQAAHSPRPAPHAQDGALRVSSSTPDPRHSGPDTETREAAAGDVPDAEEPAPGASGRVDSGGPDARFAEIPLALVVNTDDYRLTVYRYGAPAHTFPVGLGEDGATPKGVFRIANMITDPDWYNRGETMPAGDPRNPLGRHWMGLGGEHGATSYGIHPTAEPGSIGGNRSRGCVRMRPADAARLFGMCEVGTPVLIEP